MKINHPDTIKKCRFLLRAELARELEVSAALVNAVINGTYPVMDGPKALLVINWLRDRNMLVEDLEVNDEKIAA